LRGEAVVSLLSQPEAESRSGLIGRVVLISQRTCGSLLQRSEFAERLSPRRRSAIPLTGMGPCPCWRLA